MCAEQRKSQIDVYETNRFTKSLERFDQDSLMLIEDEIEKIIENPTVGEQKKGDLSYLRVHKFSVNSQQMLLGYSWVESKIELYLLSLGSHENFNDVLKRSRKADLKLIKSS